MGIQGLLPLLSNASQHVNLKDLSGSVAAVDVYSWLHKGLASCADGVFMGIDNQSYIDYCINRVKMVKRCGIEPILVFDGLNLPAKSSTESLRRARKNKAAARVKELLEKGAEREAKEAMKQCMDVTPDMARRLILVCREQKIKYIVAPYEADAQIAYLLKINIAHFAISEDSDLLVMNCSYVLTKLDSLGNGILIRNDRIGNCFHNFDFDTFRRMCILSGCDYLPSLKGIGIKKAKAFFEKVRDKNMKTALYKIRRMLNMKNIHVSPEYVDNFIKAENAFKYQLVYCPLANELRPLTDYEEGVSKEDVAHAGGYFDQELAKQLAVGNVDLDTMKIIDDFREDLSSTPQSKWTAVTQNIVTELIKGKEFGYRRVDLPFPLKRRVTKSKEVCKPTKKLRCDNDVVETSQLDDELFSEYLDAQTPTSSQRSSSSSRPSSLSQLSLYSSPSLSPPSSVPGDVNCRILQTLDNRVFVRSRYFVETSQIQSSSNSKEITSVHEEKRRRISLLYKDISPKDAPKITESESESDCDLEDVIEQLKREKLKALDE